MGRLVYSMFQSLDGYINDADGRFDWAEPDEDVHTYANQLQRGIEMNLMGRRMYEVMSAWETLGTQGDEPPYVKEFGELWRASDKIVYSTTLDSVSAARGLPRTPLRSRGRAAHEGLDPGRHLDRGTAPGRSGD